MASESPNFEDAGSGIRMSDSGWDKGFGIGIRDSGSGISDQRFA